MKQECQIVQDLLPLYEEELASEGSIAYIKEHCKICESCARVMVRSSELEEVVKEDRKDIPRQKKYNSELDVKRAIIKAKVKRGLRYILGLILICILGGLAGVGYEYQKYSKDGLTYIQKNINAYSGHGLDDVQDIIDIDLYDLSKNNNKVIAMSGEHTLWLTSIYLKEETENKYIYALECKSDVNCSFTGASLLGFSLDSNATEVATLNGKRIFFREDDVGSKGWWDTMPKETFIMNLIVDKYYHQQINEGDIVKLNISGQISEWDLDNTSEILKTAIYGMGVGALIFILTSLLFLCFKWISLRIKRKTVRA